MHRQGLTPPAAMRALCGQCREVCRVAADGTTLRLQQQPPQIFNGEPLSDRLLPLPVADLPPTGPVEVASLPSCTVEPSDVAIVAQN